MIRANLTAHVYNQLPATIRDCFKIKVNSDAYLIRPTVVFTDPQGRDWDTPLEPVEVEGVTVRCKVPDVFLAQLCTVV